MEIRAESSADAAAVHALNRAAFGTDEEAALVERLHASAAPVISLVADDGSEIVGHILFSEASLKADPALRALGLGPMAIAPARQNRGIGSALVDAGLARCRELGYQAVFVLGHAHYYPRFGFRPASEFGIRSRYDVPDEVFMALELVPDALASKAGEMRYHPAFDNL